MTVMDEAPTPAAPEAPSSSVPTRPEGKVSSFGLPRLFRTVDITPEVTLPREKLENTPSAADGCSADLEKELRFLGCELIQSMGILLKLPQVAAATGQILYQRYFYSKSFARNNYEHVAMACINLASKIEECPRRVRDSLNVFHFLKQSSRLRSVRSAKRPKPMTLGPEYVLLKNSVIKAERRVLKELGFCVHVKHPHKLIQAYLTALGSPGLMSRAWGYMNDGLRSDVFVRYSAETIACAAIFLAARVDATPLPLKPRPWWELFDVSEADVLDIAGVLLGLYGRAKAANWVRVDKAALGLMTEYKGRLNVARLGSDSANATPVTGDLNATPSKGKARNESRNESRRDERRKDRRDPSPVIDRQISHSPGRRRRERSNGADAKKSRKAAPNVDKETRRHKDKRGRSPSSPPSGYKAAPPSEAGDKRRKRSRSRDRLRQMKEREREVKKTLGKRKRSASPDDERRRTRL